MVGLEVLIADESSERNALSVSTSRTEVTVRDAAAALEAGDGCVAVAPDTVRCTEDIVSGVRAHLRGGADAGSVGTSECGCVALFGDRGDDELEGGPDGDGLIGGQGHDSLTGNAGDDGIRGGAGNDTLLGGVETGLDATVPPGDDRLDGGPGDDVIDDGDTPNTSIGRDTVIGGPDVDEVLSYSLRTEGVNVKLGDRRRNDGQEGERDMLVNVETVYGGRNDDTLIGDGDDNQLFGFKGYNRLEGRGGDDFLVATGAKRSAISGGAGGDRALIDGYTKVRVRCGPGRDTVQERATGADAPRVLRESDVGPRIQDTCESIARAGGGWASDPVPALSGRLLTFDRPRGGQVNRHISLVLTGTTRPFEEIARGNATRDGVTMRLPAAFARDAHRYGGSLRVAAYRGGSDSADVYMVWRFRLPPHPP
jgi:hypothetical protein